MGNSNYIIANTGFTDYEAKIKLLVLAYSVTFEDLASRCLKLILKLDESSVSLGNTSRALTMNQKVQLLLDTTYLDENNKPCILKFVEIRNQFMHNHSVSTFETCFSVLNGTEGFLEKVYNKKKKANNEAGGDRALKEDKDKEINNKDLLPFNINDKEKLLYKYWVSLTEDVIAAFEEMLEKIATDRTFETRNSMVNNNQK